MFSRPLFRSSVWSDPFFDDPWFDDWNELLRQQWQEQQTFKQQRQQQQQQQQQQQPARIKQRRDRDDEKESSNMEIEHKYDGGNSNNNTGTNNSGTGRNTNNGQQLVNRPSTSGTVTRPSRSFWDLTSFPSWSGLTPQAIRLEWSGTESTAKEYVVSAFLPDGMTAADVNIEMDERTRMLTLKCQQKSHEEEKDQDGHIISSRSSSSHVERALQVPHDVDISAINAAKGSTSTSGSSGSPQLVLHLPKYATPQPKLGVKQITIRN